MTWSVADVEKLVRLAERAQDPDIRREAKAGALAILRGPAAEETRRARAESRRHWAFRTTIALGAALIVGLAWAVTTDRLTLTKATLSGAGLFVAGKIISEVVKRLVPNLAGD